MTSGSVVGALISNIVQPLIKLMFIVAILIFVWGVVEMIMNASSEEARQKGTRHMMWGLIGLFVMFAVYGILNFLIDTLRAGS